MSQGGANGQVTRAQGTRLVFCDSGGGAPTCAPAPKPREISETDQLVREFVRRHARVVEKLNNEIGTTIELRNGRLGTVPQVWWSLGRGDVAIGGRYEVNFFSNDKAVAAVHLHTGHDQSSFSDWDLDDARARGLPDYVSINRGQYILRFDPRANTITRLPGIWGQELPTGGFVP